MANPTDIPAAPTSNGSIIRDDNASPAGYNYKSITGQATTTVKSGAGFLHAIDFTATAAGVITVYDNTTNSGTVIRTITSPATLLQNEVTKILDLNFNIGLTVVTATANQDIVITYV